MANPQNVSLQSFTPPDERLKDTALMAEIMKNVNCARPGVIDSYDPVKQTVIVQVAQLKVTSILPDGTRILDSFAPLAQLPVIFPGGGGFTLTFPIAKGDECLVLFNDRDLSAWKTTGAGQAPASPRLHDLTDGFALVGIRSFPRALSAPSTTSTQLRSDDGATYIEIAADGVVNLVAPGGCNIRADVVIQGNMDVQGNGGSDTATIDCNLTQTSGKVLKAGNGATGTFNTVTVADGIVTGGS